MENSTNKRKGVEKMSNNAQYISNNVPVSGVPGAVVPVQVTFKNTGTTTWVNTGSNPWRLGSQDPQDNMNFAWGRTNVPNSVAPGQSVTFNFNITIPAVQTPFQCRVLQEGIEWFGDFSPVIMVTPIKRMIDMLEYNLADSSHYRNVTVPNSGRTGAGINQVFYKHVNGDIDYFACRWGNYWNFEYLKYIASEEMFHFMYDCEDTSPGMDCGHPFRFSLGPSSGVVGGHWLPRYWSQGDEVNMSSAYGASWRENKTVCGSWIPAGYKIRCHEIGTKNFGGDCGTRDYVTWDFVHLDTMHIERNTFAKGWGFVSWNTYDENGNIEQAYTPNIYISNATRVVPECDSICPNVIYPTGPYLSASNGGGGDVIPNRAIPRNWEQFTVTKVSGDIYNIQANNGKYLCAENGGGGTVVANRDTPTQWEQFTLERQSDGYYALKTYDGVHYLCAENGGEAPLVANRMSIGAWELFGFHLVSGNNYQIWTYNKSVFGPEFATMPPLSTLA